MAIHLVATTQTLIIAMAESPTTQPSFIFNVGDRSTGVEPAVQLGTLTDASDTTIVAAPASGEQRLVMNGYVTNLDAAAITLTPTFDDNSDQNDYGTYSVGPGESLVFDGNTWQVITPNDSVAPSFNAYLSSTQSGVVTNTWTKVQCNTEDWDTHSDYDNSTNYRYTPSVAGKYLVICKTQLSAIDDTEYTWISIYKNGTRMTANDYFHNSPTTTGASNMIIALVEMNGSTDYIEMFGQHSQGANQSFVASTCRFQAVRVSL